MAINRVTISGHITADPKLVKTREGDSVCSFSLAVANRRKNPDGTRDATFVQCVVWKNQADYLVETVKKGDTVVVDGYLQARQYTKKTNNETITITELNVENFQSFKTSKEDPAKLESVETSTEVAVDADLPEADLEFVLANKYSK